MPSSSGWHGKHHGMASLLAWQTSRSLTHTHPVPATYLCECIPVVTSTDCSLLSQTQCWANGWASNLMLLSTFIVKPRCSPAAHNCAKGDCRSSWHVCMLAHFVEAQRRQLQEWAASIAWHVCQILLPVPARVCRFLPPWLQIRSVGHLLTTVCSVQKTWLPVLHC